MSKASQVVNSVQASVLKKTGLSPEVYSGERRQRILDAEFDGMYVDRVMDGSQLGKTIERVFAIQDGDGSQIVRVGFDDSKRTDFRGGVRYVARSDGDAAWAPNDGLIERNRSLRELRGKKIVGIERTLDDHRGASPDIVDFRTEGNYGFRVALIQRNGNPLGASITSGLLTMHSPTAKVVERYAA